MKQDNKVNIFSLAFKIWFSQILNMSIFIIIGILILLFCTNILKIEAVSDYGIYIKIFILVLSYIGILVGTHKSFNTIVKHKKYISKAVKYIVLVLQFVFFGIFTYICILVKLDVVFYVGIYLILFVQFIFNTLYIFLNNRKYTDQNTTIKHKKDEQVSSKSNNTIIDIDKLK